MLYLLDTNICIYAMNKRPLHVLERLTKMKPTSLAVSAVTVLEVWFGAEKSARQAANKLVAEAFFAQFLVLPFDGEAAKQAGVIRARLEQTGSKIGDYDAMIAGHALARNLTVVTNNVREFSRVPGLQVENWALA